MSLSFLTQDLRSALDRLNLDFLTEIRYRQGKPVIVEYRGEYKYLGRFGLTDRREEGLVATSAAKVIEAATGGSVYNYAEQIKRGFITCGHGIRIGLGGEYVTQNGEICTIRDFTSLNIRIPHDVKDCAKFECERLLMGDIPSILLFSRPGLGKTTRLRDIARFLSGQRCANVLVFDERNEIAALDGTGNGFDLGDRTDVVRAGNKVSAFSAAIRAMKPDVIICDELYGAEDVAAARFAVDCGIPVIASSHMVDRKKLSALPFDYFVELKPRFGQPEIYDKNFNSCSGGGRHLVDRGVSVGE